MSPYGGRSATDRRTSKACSDRRWRAGSGCRLRDGRLEHLVGQASQLPGYRSDHLAVQRRWATTSSAFHGTSTRTKFLCTDAEELTLPAASRDVVWSIECTEHLFNKGAFFAKARQWLKPGGRLAICAWLAGHDESASQTQKLCYDVCEGFFCPSLGTQADYEGWFRNAGLEVVHSELWTKRVLKTWEICRDRVQRTGVRHLARMLGQDHVMFLDRFDAILEATKLARWSMDVSSRVLSVLLSEAGAECQPVRFHRQRPRR